MSFSRRRIIALLTLTTILLVTLDVRNSSVVSGSRGTFAAVMQPLQRVGRMVSRPVENAWHGIREYDDLKAENDTLREQIAEQEGDSLAVDAVIMEFG